MKNANVNSKELELLSSVFERFKNVLRGQEPQLEFHENANESILKITEPWTTHDTIALTEELVHKGYTFQEYIPFGGYSSDSPEDRRNPILIFVKKIYEFPQEVSANVKGTV